MPRRAIASWACLLLLAAALAGCAAEPGEVLVDYERGGGIAGWYHRLVIRANGQATLTSWSEDQEFVLDREALDELGAVFESVEFASLDDEYLPPGQVPDAFEYVITYQGHTVHTMDSAVPEALWPVLDRLNGIMQGEGWQ